MENILKGSLGAAFLALMTGVFADQAAGYECAGSRCAQIRQIPPPQVHKGAHNARGQVCCCETPPGWGWYRRQRFRHECSQPLVVIDELGATVSVHENW